MNLQVAEVRVCGFMAYHRVGIIANTIFGGSPSNKYGLMGPKIVQAPTLWLMAHRLGLLNVTSG